MNKLEFVLNKIIEKCPELKGGHYNTNGISSLMTCLPVQLEHLLLTCYQQYDEDKDYDRVNLIDGYICLSHCGLQCMYSKAIAPYDLTKSVTDNLKSNENLLNFLYSLFNQEDL